MAIHVVSFPRRREPISTQVPHLAILMVPRLRGEDTTRLEIKQRMRLPCVQQDKHLKSPM